MFPHIEIRSSAQLWERCFSISIYKVFVFLHIFPHRFVFVFFFFWVFSTSSIINKVKWSSPNLFNLMVFEWYFSICFIFFIVTTCSWIAIIAKIKICSNLYLAGPQHTSIQCLPLHQLDWNKIMRTYENKKLRRKI